MPLFFIMLRFHGIRVTAPAPPRFIFILPRQFIRRRRYDECLRVRDMSARARARTCRLIMRACVLKVSLSLYAATPSNTEDAKHDDIL